MPGGGENGDGGGDNDGGDGNLGDDASDGDDDDYGYHYDGCNLSPPQRLFILFIMFFGSLRIVLFLCFDHTEGKEKLGISSFGVSVTTLEDVFIKVGEGMEQTVDDV